jgi:hypothetical protein
MASVTSEITVKVEIADASKALLAVAVLLREPGPLLTAGDRLANIDRIVRQAVEQLQIEKT